MKALIACTALALTMFSAHAEEKAKKEPTPAQKAQQEKMKACNASAGKKGLKGDERKTFMSECLKSGK
ncbi:PsiF family protein [Propionivibrio limicola]|uniref:PsiF family protein n=1 Tax=Propionivibrio limicola TaxID=167645 RepID=UPI0012926136